MFKTIIANFKMFGSVTGLRDYPRLLQPYLNDSVAVVICPPFPYLTLLKGLKKGGQDCHWSHNGAFTGEVSAAMLRDVGCEYVILGHSERRQAGETSALIAKKLVAALQHDLIPIICVGESLAEYQQGQTLPAIAQQLQETLPPLVAATPVPMIIAYEPIWAIGSGLTPTPEEITTVHRFIKEHWPLHLVIYGGSVKPENAQAILTHPLVDGALVGGGSLNPHQFGAILAAVS